MGHMGGSLHFINKKRIQTRVICKNKKMQTRMCTNAKTAYMGLVHYAPEIDLCGQIVKNGRYAFK